MTMSASEYVRGLIKMLNEDPASKHLKDSYYHMYLELCLKLGEWPK